MRPHAVALAVAFLAAAATTEEAWQAARDVVGDTPRRALADCQKPADAPEFVSQVWDLYLGECRDETEAAVACEFPDLTLCEALDETAVTFQGTSADQICAIFTTTYPSLPNPYQSVVCEGAIDDEACRAKRNALSDCAFSNICSKDFKCEPVSGGGGGSEPEPSACDPPCFDPFTCCEDSFLPQPTCLPQALCAGGDFGGSEPSPSPKPVALTTPEPSPEPSTGNEPTASGGFVCENDATWTKKNDPSKDCAWVAKQPAARCLVKSGSAVLAGEACLEACGGCAPAAACADDPAWHKAGSPAKRCAWASRFSNRLAALGEDGRYGYQACPAAARTCRKDVPCGDSSTWSKNKDPSKSCDWVAELPEARCLVKDASTVLAAEACKATCGSCGTCVDEPGWHKAGDPSRDCTWVSRFTNRLAVEGEDGTLAYQSCRLSARTCGGL
mmetsp:Transcript_17744/g.55381  ORF Transcript_17744/g.55381 Transcript_17744/m.55381 type:complete len:444 (+) Transcript_17744:177-1508(+)